MILNFHVEVEANKEDVDYIKHLLLSGVAPSHRFFRDVAKVTYERNLAEDPQWGDTIEQELWEEGQIDL